MNSLCFRIVGAAGAAILIAELLKTLVTWQTATINDYKDKSAEEEQECEIIETFFDAERAQRSCGGKTGKFAAAATISTLLIVMHINRVQFDVGLRLCFGSICWGRSPKSAVLSQIPQP